MNNMSFKKAATLFLFLISACKGTQAVAPTQSRNPADTSSLTATATTEDTVVTATEQPVIKIRPLTHSIDYIVYSKHNDQEIWAVDPNKLTPVLVATDIIPRSWSPSNKLWLFTGNQSVYIADADGSNIHHVYTYKNYKGIDPFWLTDDTVLFNAYKDYLLPPDMFSLNIDSGIATPLFPGSNEFVQATFPLEKDWIKAGLSTETGGLSFVDQNGKEEKLFDSFLISTDPFVKFPPIQQIDKLGRYILKAKKAEDTNYKLWVVSKQEPPQVLFDPKSGGIDEFAVSPDREFVALTYSSLDGEQLYVFSLNNLQPTYKWVYPYKLGGGEFIWSPDSQHIVLPYSESDIGTSASVSFGIQVMNIRTGQTKLILNEDVTQIIDWRYIK